MPFRSKAQMRLCWYLKSQGKAGSWDCSEWAKHSKNKRLPEYKKSKSKKRKSKKKSRSRRK